MKYTCGIVTLTVASKVAGMRKYHGIGVARTDRPAELPLSKRQAFAALFCLRRDLRYANREICVPSGSLVCRLHKRAHAPVVFKAVSIRSRCFASAPNKAHLLF